MAGSLRWRACPGLCCQPILQDRMDGNVVGARVDFERLRQVSIDGDPDEPSASRITPKQVAIALFTVACGLAIHDLGEDRNVRPHYRAAKAWRRLAASNLTELVWCAGMLRRRLRWNAAVRRVRTCEATRCPIGRLDAGGIRAPTALSSATDSGTGIIMPVDRDVVNLSRRGTSSIRHNIRRPPTTASGRACPTARKSCVRVAPRWREDLVVEPVQKAVRMQRSHPPAS